MTRREMREAAFKLIFEKQFNDDSLEEILALTEEVGDIPMNEASRSLLRGVVEKSAELDDIIGKFSPKRTVSRIPRVNLVILRVALYEILYGEDMPASVAINEAVELAKKFAQKEDAAFVNGVLGAYARAAEAEEKA